MPKHRQIHICFNYRVLPYFWLKYNILVLDYKIYLIFKKSLHFWLLTSKRYTVLFILVLFYKWHLQKWLYFTSCGLCMISYTSTNIHSSRLNKCNKAYQNRSEHFLVRPNLCFNSLSAVRKCLQSQFRAPAL